MSDKVFTYKDFKYIVAKCSALKYFLLDNLTIYSINGILN